MKAVTILKQGIPLFCLLMGGLLAGCAHAPAPAEVPQAKELGEIKQVIEVEADGLVLHYLCQSFWAEEEFSTHRTNQAQFEADFKQDFEQGLAQSDRPISASDYSFSFDSATQSTPVRCDVHGAISKTDNDYRATFFWLLKPLGLDFIYDDFKESEKGLSWEGSIQGIPTSIILSFPASIDHCHAHVWWSTGG